MTGLATTLQAFFTDRLVRQRQVSTNTIQAYRDTLRLLLVFASERQGKSPVRLDIDDLDAPLIGAFLDHLEQDRGNAVRTRNARLAALRAFLKFAGRRDVTALLGVEQAMADANQTITQSMSLCETLVTTGALTATRNLVVPLRRATWIVRNDCTGGSIQVIGATGTGTTIATVKTAIVSCDGTNVVRVTADA